MEMGRPLEHQCLAVLLLIAAAGSASSAEVVGGAGVPSMNAPGSSGTPENPNCTFRENWLRKKIETSQSPEALLKQLASKPSKVIALGELHNHEGAHKNYPELLKSLKEGSKDLNCLYIEASAEEQSTINQYLQSDLSDKAFKDTIEKARNAADSEPEGEMADSDSESDSRPSMPKIYSEFEMSQPGFVPKEERRTPLAGVDKSLLDAAKRLGIKVLAVDSRHYASLDMENRNSHMSNRIAESLKSKKCAKGVFIVGKAHIHGENSATQQLEKSGVPTTKINMVTPKEAGGGGEFSTGACKGSTFNGTSAGFTINSGDQFQTSDKSSSNFRNEKWNDYDAAIMIP